MQHRSILKTVTGKRTTDGAGVRLTRVLGAGTMYDFDPFLMLDSFDSTNPDDYTLGFPRHPHRGIETITYLIEGSIEHEDSLGNKGFISAGESQWMTAGSGIIHQEMPKAAARMLGFQLWLNLPRAEKMTKPHYFEITNDMVGETHTPAADIRVIAGEYNGVKGASPLHVKATIMDVWLHEGQSIELPVKKDETAFVFLIEGYGIIADSSILEKTAVLLGNGNTVCVSAPTSARTRFILCAGTPLEEPIAWGGPIVMNTREELLTAFDDLEKGTFITK